MTDLQNIYFKMLRIRRVEQEIARRYPEQQMRTPVHLSIGQEASAVGVSEFLNEKDLVVSTHRSHAHYLAKGGSLRGLISELYGKRSGCSRGIGGSMHLIDRSVGFMGSTSIVGGTIPVGAGLAFSKRIKNEDGVVIIYIGDAAVEEGVFHETANFVGLHKLPVVFVLENNLYSCYTHLNDRQPERSFQHLALAHGLSYVESCGNDVVEILKSIRNVFNLAPKGHPHLLVLNTYRHLEHCGPNNDDHLKYREPGEIKSWVLEKDPITLLEKELFRRGEWTTEFVDNLVIIDEEIRVEFEFAIKDEPLEMSALKDLEYAPY